MSNEPTQDVTQLLAMAAAGDSRATDELLPVVYQELRRMARVQLGHEKPGQTLQPTALVHEAYLRLVGNGDVAWNNRGHFFGAASQAMRRILVERARHRSRDKRGGGARRVDLSDHDMVTEPDVDVMLALDEVLERLTVYDKQKSQIVMLRFFAGLTVEQTAEALNLSVWTVKSEWAYARAWMHREMAKSEPPGESASEEAR